METKELNFRRYSETEKNRKRIQGIAKKYEFFFKSNIKIWSGNYNSKDSPKYLGLFQAALKLRTSVIFPIAFSFQVINNVKSCITVSNLEICHLK